MKKIILATVFGALLSAGSVMAAGVPAGDDVGDLTMGGNGHAGGMQALTDGIAFDQEDSLDMVFRGKEDDVFLSGAYSYQGQGADNPKWMMKHAEQNGDGSPAVPVPGTILLLGSGLAGLIFIRRGSMQSA